MFSLRLFFSNLPFHFKPKLDLAPVMLGLQHKSQQRKLGGGQSMNRVVWRWVRGTLSPPELWDGSPVNRCRRWRARLPPGGSGLSTRLDPGSGAPPLVIGWFALISPSSTFWQQHMCRQNLAAENWTKAGKQGHLYQLLKALLIIILGEMEKSAAPFYCLKG